MREHSVRSRLLAGLCILTFILVVPVLIYIHVNIEEQDQKNIEKVAVNSLKSAEWTLAQLPAFSESKYLDVWAGLYQQTTGNRISYIVDGKVLADSAMEYKDILKLPSHSARKEVVDANAGKTSTVMRQSSTTHLFYVYAAKKTNKIKGLPEGVLRIAVPVTSQANYMPGIAETILAAFIIAVLGGTLLTFLITKPLSRNIKDLSALTNRIGQGEYALRLPDDASVELKPLLTAINNMAANIEKHTSNLEERKRRLEALFNSMSEGVMVIDQTAHIVNFNHAAAIFFPALLSHLVHTPMEATMSSELQQAVEDILNIKSKNFISQRPGLYTAPTPSQQVILKTDADKVLAANLVPFGESGSRRIVCVFTDISEQESLRRMQRDFVANVSHELRTPLTNIAGYAEALEERLKKDHGSENAALADFVDTIIKNASHMKLMVDDLLTISKTEHYKTSANLESVDLVNSLKTTASQFQFQAKNVGSYIDIIPPQSSDPIYALGYKEGFFTVFHNILDNAIKYGTAGETITIKVDDDSDNFIYVYFSNKGDTIPESEREKVFERFYRLQDADEDISKKGSGLGLSICKKIMDICKGEIFITTPKGYNGTTVALKFLRFGTQTA